jgi:hypothetical protein
MNEVTVNFILRITEYERHNDTPSELQFNTIIFTIFKEKKTNVIIVKRLISRRLQ